MNRLFLRVLLLVPAVYLLFFFRLTSTGLLGPDEPRYAAIGREMASSGDWVTPRLWGDPWFEKPALLYWMTGAAFRSGLNEDLAPRLPVALISLGFLVFFQRLLEREFGRLSAWYATLILATTAGWIAFSQLGVTDLPMTAAFSAAMLLLLRWSATGKRALIVLAGVSLGLAVLAKGLVPLVLALPGFWFGRKRWRELLLVPAVAFLTAAPWYIACTLRNGASFLEDFFWKHHFERFSSDAIQHVQPFWFYVPVLLAGLFPWTPVLATLPIRRVWEDARLRFLFAWLAFGFLFFSASTNKLPGYLLPLFPPLCALIGVSLAASKRGKWMLALSAVLLAVFPAASQILPDALRQGLSRAGPLKVSVAGVLPFLLLAVLVLWWDRRAKRAYALSAIFAATVACVAYSKVTLLPFLDRSVSARQLWRQLAPRREQVCVEPVHRAWRYGLNYYSVEPLPACDEAQRPLRVRQRPGQPAYLAD